MNRPRLLHLVPLAVLALGVGLATAAPASAAATTYTITNLGSLGGGVTLGTAINASGQVTGYSLSSTQVQVPCHGKHHPTTCFTNPYDAFVWSNGTMTSLGTLGGTLSEGVAISGSGEVVGFSTTTVTGPSTGVPFLWNGHSMTALSEPTGADGINDSGQIAGQCFDAELTQTTPCVVSSSGAITELGVSNPDIICLYIDTLPAAGPSADAINDSGQVLGNCPVGDNEYAAIVWTNDTPTVLPTLGGASALGTAISSNGLVVGTSTTSTGAEDGFLWSNGTMTDLGSTFSPAAVNASGVIVGGQFVYSNGTLQNLNNLIPAGSGYTIQSATGINDNGQIVADATDTATGQTQALLLNPS